MHPTSTDKFRCPRCGGWKSGVVRSLPDTEGTRYLRWRHCAQCHQVFETAEAVTGREIPPHGPKGDDHAPS
jgi:transcriptional regulator NrdR family protein